MPRIGVLALQGDFAAHAAAFRELGCEVAEVRRTAQFDGLDGLVIPGGESTTLLNLMQDEPWFPEIRRFHAQGGAILGTCAGTILLARRVVDPPQASLGLLDVVVRRNGYGRQVDSFEAPIRWRRGAGGTTTAVFIRAPRLIEVAAHVERLALWREEPVFVRQGRVLGATFHPELTPDRRLHDNFLKLTLAGSSVPQSRRGAGRETRPVRAAQRRRVSC